MSSPSEAQNNKSTAKVDTGDHPSDREIWNEKDITAKSSPTKQKSTTSIAQEVDGDDKITAQSIPMLDIEARSLGKRLQKLQRHCVTEDLAIILMEMTTQG